MPESIPLDISPDKSHGYEALAETFMRIRNRRIGRRLCGSGADRLPRVQVCLILVAAAECRSQKCSSRRDSLCMAWMRHRQ